MVVEMAGGCVSWSFTSFGPCALTPPARRVPDPAMTFAVAAEAYDRYIGRYSRALAPRFLEFAGVTSGPVLEVGCGPGSLTAVLAARFGAVNVAAVDPSESFVAACRERVPGAEVRVGSGESLPFVDGAFEGALSQLVLSFVREPDQLTAELSRVVRRDGMVAACTFEANGFALVRTFWDAALRLDPKAPDDASIPFRREAELLALWNRAGFREVRTGVIDGPPSPSASDRRAATCWPSPRTGAPPSATPASCGSRSRPAPSRSPLASSPSAVGCSGSHGSNPGASRRDAGRWGPRRAPLNQ